MKQYVVSEYNTLHLHPILCFIYILACTYIPSSLFVHPHRSWWGPSPSHPLFHLHFCMHIHAIFWSSSPHRSRWDRLEASRYNLDSHSSLWLSSVILRKCHWPTCTVPWASPRVDGSRQKKPCTTTPHDTVSSADTEDNGLVTLYDTMELSFLWCGELRQALQERDRILTAVDGA